MKPPLDTPKTIPTDQEILGASAAVARFRGGLVDSVSGDSTKLSDFGLQVLKQFELRPTDVALTANSLREHRRVYEEIARRFLDCVLPGDDDLRHMDASCVEEFVAAIGPERPDLGRLIAAFGLARFDTFGSDYRLKYRVGGYRGRPGNLLTDYFIQAVIEPAVAAVGSAAASR